MKEKWMCVEGVALDSGFCEKVTGAKLVDDKEGRKWCECKEGTHLKAKKDAKDLL
jgi:hypothetical protein